MFCKNCGMQCNDNDTVCGNCGAKLNNVPKPQNAYRPYLPPVKPVLKSWWLWLLIILYVIILLANSCVLAESIYYYNYFHSSYYDDFSEYEDEIPFFDGKEFSQEQTSSEEDKYEYNEDSIKMSLAQTCQFSGLQLTIGDAESIKWVELNQNCAEYAGSLAAEIPVKIKNISNDKNSLNINMFNIYDPNGNKLDKAGSGMQNDVYNMLDLYPNDETEMAFHILYEGDGTYHIVLGLDIIDISIPLVK